MGPNNALASAREEQKKRWLPEVAKGRTWTAVAMTEPESDSDVASMKTHRGKSRLMSQSEWQ